jgi:hypothetical protein
MQYRAGELAADRILHLVGAFAGVPYTPREFWRKLDHPATFLMIAAIWTGAVTGAVMKLIGRRGVEGGSIVTYLTPG